MPFSKLGLLPFPQHFAHGLGDDAGKVAAEASDIGPDTLKAIFNFAQPDMKLIQLHPNRTQAGLNRA